MPKRLLLSCFDFVLVFILHFMFSAG